MELITEIYNTADSIDEIQKSLELLYEKNNTAELDNKIRELFTLKKKLLDLEKKAYLEMPPTTVGQAVDLYLINIHDTRDNNPDGFKYNVTLHDTKTVIGEVEVRFKMLESELYLGNYGAYIKDEYKGKRYSKQAFIMLRDVLLEHGISKPIFTVRNDNEKSIKALANIGATRIGNFMHDEIDHYIYEYDLEKKNSK